MREQRSADRQNIFNSPSRLLLLMTLSIFTVEATVMAIIHFLPTLPAPVELFFDSLILVSLLSPMLYYFFFRPLLVHIGERKKMEDVLQRERNKLKSILDAMKDGVYIVNRLCNIEYVNPVIEREFGMVQGRKCYKYFHDRSEVCPWCRNEEVFAGKSVQWEWYSPKTGKTYDLFDTPIRNEDGSISKLELFHDITDRKRVEDALRKSEMLMDKAQKIAHLGSWEYDFAGNRLTWSDEVYRIFGLKPQEFGGTYEAFLEAVHPDDREAVDTAYSKSLIERLESYEIEHRLVRKSTGEVRVVHEKCEHVRDGSGRIIRSVGMIHDITTRKLAEAALQESERRLRLLSSQLITAQDAERERISRDLHDELGQSLTLIKLQAYSIKRGLSGDQFNMRNECENVLGQIDTVIENIRRIAHDLSPPVLADLGLTVAVRRLVNNFGRTYYGDVVLNIEDIDMFLPQEEKIIIYRFIQEALSNIGKHAGARNVSIIIEKNNGLISFVVQDDGKGFNVREAVMNRAERGLGLAIMEERSRMLGGSFAIQSEEGKGTRISFAMPVKKEEKV